MKRSALRRDPGHAKLTVRLPEVKTCAHCSKDFAPQRPMQNVCSPRCALRKVKAERAEEKAQVRRAIEQTKSRATLVREAQTAFNAWIRARDAQLPCVSCGRHHQGQWHAGHYRSTAAAPELRFDEANVHKQCAPCNTHLSGNLVPYRAELLRRVGLAELERLEGPQKAKKYTPDELRAIRDSYRAKTKAALKQAELLDSF